MLTSCFFPEIFGDADMFYLILITVNVKPYFFNRNALQHVTANT